MPLDRTSRSSTAFRISGATFSAFLAISLTISVFLGRSLTVDSFSGRSLHEIEGFGLAEDGYIAKEAMLSVRGFEAGMNRLEMRVSPFHGDSTGFARIAVSMCGGLEREYDADARQTVALEVPRSCSPIELRVRVLGDGRSRVYPDSIVSGVRLTSLRVVSDLGAPIPSFRLILGIFTFLASFALLIGIVASRLGYSPVFALAGALFLACLFVYGMGREPEVLMPFGVFVLGCLLGGIMFYTIGDHGDRRDPVSSYWIYPIVFAGAALRLYGIDFGLPAKFHPDEPVKVNVIMGMVDSGSLNPRYFWHPSLLLYSTYATNMLLHALGVEGAFQDTAFVAGRLVSFTAGTLSIFLTYLIGRRMYSKVVGLYAASLLAVFPLHVTCSRYLKEDALLTFMVLLSLLLTVASVRSGKRWILLVAGLVSGFAAGTKYSAIVQAAVPAVAPWLVSRSCKPDRRWLPWSAFAASLAPIGFLITNPYALLDSPEFIKGFLYEYNHMQAGHNGVAITAWSRLWMYQFWQSLWSGTSGVFAVLAVVSLVYSACRSKTTDLFLLGVVLLYFMPAEYVKVKVARYILPCLPLMAIASSVFLRQLTANGALGRLLGYLLACACLTLSLFRSLSLARDLKDDTRVRAAQWINGNLPVGSKILLGGAPFGNPPLRKEDYAIDYYRKDSFYQDLDIEHLQRSGAHYLVLSSSTYMNFFIGNSSDPKYRKRFQELFDRLPVVKQISAVSGSYIFHNPVITVFSLRHEDIQRLRERKELASKGLPTPYNDHAAPAIVW